MSMNFDTYSTSFQSLMSPMYNIQANYNANLYGNGGAGIGNGIYGGGYGFGNGAYGYMGGFMGPMMNVGIGQFNADYLLKGEDQKNNYYARPIPVHKKENETGTMLGILGTALGTAALIAALLKGKRVKAPKTGHTPAAPAPAPTAPTPAPAAASTIAQSGNLPTVAPKYINRHTGVTDADKIKQQIMYGLNHPVQVNTSNAAGNKPQIAGLLPAKTSRQAQAIAEQQAALNLPSSGQVYTTPVLPGQTQSVAGYLPAQTSRQAQAIAKQQAALNLPSSGQVYTMGTPELANVNKNMMNIRPDLMRNGEIVYTTHTPETLSNGYSIGSNAKGGDKLAQLLQQMQG